MKVGTCSAKLPAKRSWFRPRGVLRHTALCRALLLAVLALGHTACRRTQSVPPSTTEPQSAPWFDVQTTSAGLAFQHRPFTEQRYYFPEIMGAGVCLFDADEDGLLDIYVIQSGQFGDPRGKVAANVLFRNLGNGTFEDVTDAAGVGDTGYGMGCACGDYDGDGDVDLYVTNCGPNVLYRNEGAGRFTDVSTAAGVADAGWGTSAAFVDYDRDGALDLFVVNYVNWSPTRELTCLAADDRRDYCNPDAYASPSRDTSYHNRGDGTFRDDSLRVGLDKARGNGLGVAPADFDDDGYLDIYVANDGTANHLWLWDPQLQQFSDHALFRGCAVNRAGQMEAGMGVAAFDLEHDGDVDLFMSHLRNQSNTLYVNQNGLFNDATSGLGLGAASMPFTGFGLGLADFDHDGHQDIFIANGRVTRQEPHFRSDAPFVEPDVLFVGQSSGRFAEHPLHGGTLESRVESGRGAAFGDIDNDGDIDVVVSNNHGPLQWLRNDAASGQWIMFDVRESDGRRAVGARIGISAAGRRQWRIAQRAYSYCSSNDPRVHFGLGAATTADDVEVRWADGSVSRFGSFPAGRVHKLSRETAPSKP